MVGWEAGATRSRPHERFGYAYDAAGNLNYRTNYQLVQTFNVNSLNELTTVTRPYMSSMVVAGTTSAGATNVTVWRDGLSPVTAVLYGDSTWVLRTFLPSQISPYWRRKVLGLLTALAS